MATSGIAGIVIDQVNFVTGTVSGGLGQLVGWEYPAGGPAWIFRRDITEFFDAVAPGGALEVKGLVGGTGVALLRWNTNPMTPGELDPAETEEGNLLLGSLPASGIAAGRSLMDCRFRALRIQGFQGTTSDMLREWLAVNGAGLPLRHINDMWRDMLIAQGFTPEMEYQYNDAWYAFLGVQGFTRGHINDRELDFWCDGGGFIIPPVDDAFSFGFSDGFA